MISLPGPWLSVQALVRSRATSPAPPWHRSRDHGHRPRPCCASASVATTISTDFSASSTGSTVSSQSSVCQRPITAVAGRRRPAAISRVTREQRMCSDRMADVSRRLLRRLAGGEIRGRRALEQHREWGHVMGRRPLDRLEKRGVEHRDLTRERGYLLERPCSFAADLHDEAPRLPPRERNPDDGADLHQVPELIRDVVPEAVVDRERWDAGDNSSRRSTQRPAAPLRASTMSRRSQENSGRPKCP